MSLYLKIILIIFGLAYLISPVDIIPDLLLPYIGWIDDGVVLWTIYYLIRYGRLPNYFFKKKKRNPFVNPSSPKSENHQNAQAQEKAKTQQEKNFSSNNQGQSHSNTKKKTNPETSLPKTAWEILGLQKGADKKDIQNAYREAIKKYHPDKLSHLGEEFSTLANEKFLEIQTAYDQLMEKYN